MKLASPMVWLFLPYVGVYKKLCVGAKGNENGFKLNPIKVSWLVIYLNEYIDIVLEFLILLISILLISYYH